MAAEPTMATGPSATHPPQSTLRFHLSHQSRQACRKSNIRETVKSGRERFAFLWVSSNCVLAPRAPGAMPIAIYSRAHLLTV